MSAPSLLLARIPLWSGRGIRRALRPFPQLVDGATLALGGAASARWAVRGRRHPDARRRGRREIVVEGARRRRRPPLFAEPRDPGDPAARRKRDLEQIAGTHGPRR